MGQIMGDKEQMGAGGGDRDRKTGWEQKKKNIWAGEQSFHSHPCLAAAGKDGR